MKLLIMSLWVAVSFSVNFATAASVYQKTEPLISNLVRAQSFSTLSLNYQNTAGIKKYALYTPSLEFVSRPQLKLAGLRFNPKNYTNIVSAYTSKLVYFDLATKKDKEIKFDKNAIIKQTTWSLDGKYLAVSIETKYCQEVWIVQIPSLSKKKIPQICMNTVMGNGIFWIDGKQLVISSRTNQQKNELNVDKTLPTGPVIQESFGKVAENRTYQDLIKTAQDEILFEQATTAQFVIYSAATSQTKKIGVPAVYDTLNFSPDLKYILVSKIIKPYSYIVPVSLFAKQYEIWSENGQLSYKLHTSGPHENLPIDGSITGPRSLRWLANEPHTIAYVQALDEGNWKKKVEFRDELFKLELLPSAKTKLTSIYKTKDRFGGLSALDRNLGYFIYEYDRDTEWQKTHWVKIENNKVTQDEIIFSRNQNDEYNDEGNEYTVLNKYNRSVIAMDPEEQSIYLSGEGATPSGYSPFLNKFNLKAKATQTLFRSKQNTYEKFLTFLDEKNFSKFVTSFETSTESPEYRVNTIKDKNTISQLLYKDENPFAVIAKLKKEVLKYKRADGVELSATLYYPLDYDASKKYPLVIDAYPLEYTDAKTAGQVRNSADTFETPYRASSLYFALQGYVVLQDAQIPIIGHPETKNDTFLQQLKDGAKAAIDAADKKGIIDRKKVGVIGHSYGAFMVANLLTHTDWFAAGIARSGAYNRTLTPFGFQGERRTFWQAKDLYLKLSPFYEADKMKSPMLLIHGQADNNSGTFTLQSERYYDALKGQGATVKLILLPEESHSYAALETIDHVLYEQFAWFDKYLK